MKVTVIVEHGRVQLDAAGGVLNVCDPDGDAIAAELVAAVRRVAQRIRREHGRQDLWHVDGQVHTPVVGPEPLPTQQESPCPPSTTSAPSSPPSSSTLIHAPGSPAPSTGTASPTSGSPSPRTEPATSGSPTSGGPATPADDSSPPSTAPTRTPSPGTDQPRTPPIDLDALDALADSTHPGLHGPDTARGGVIHLVPTGEPDASTVAALVAGAERPFATDADIREAALQLLGDDNSTAFVAKALGRDLAEVRAWQRWDREAGT